MAFVLPSGGMRNGDVEMNDTLDDALLPLRCFLVLLALSCTASGHVCPPQSLSSGGFCDFILQILPHVLAFKLAFVFLFRLPRPVLYRASCCDAFSFVTVGFSMYILG